MTDTNTLISLDELDKSIKTIEQNGKDIVLSDEADKAVATIKIAEKKIDDVIDHIREVAKEALEPYNAKSLKGKYITISVSAPRKVNEYTVDDEAEAEYWTQQVRRIPNKEAIEAYIEKNDGHLPVGVHRNELKQSVSLRLKQTAIDDYESGNFDPKIIEAN